jgi:hypothetical protein
VTSSPQLTETLAKKRERSPAGMGATCALIAVFAPVAHPVLFFLASLPLLLAAFVLAIVAIVRGKITSGILLLMGLVLALPMSFGMLVDREKILHHPEQLKEAHASGTEWQGGYLATIKRPVSAQLSAGKVALTEGLMLNASVSEDEERVRLNYRGEEIDVPANAVVLSKKR